MGGVDAIVFSAGIGENSPQFRERICDRLAPLGAKYDKEVNNQRGKSFKFSTPDSKIELWCIPTDEEIVIARDTVRLIYGKI